MPFSLAYFLHHYEGQLKTVVQQEAGEKITVEDANKVKKKSEFEKGKFLKNLTVQIMLTGRKTSLITVYLQFLKIMAKNT